MEGRKINWINTLFIALIGIVLSSIAFYKAITIAFTHDESLTYLHYVPMDFMEIISYVKPFTNNHILNTLLMKVSEGLLGTSELVLRLPNLLAHWVYMIFSFLLLKRYVQPVLVVPSFVLLNVNTYFLDFFALARGYGLGISFMMVSIYFFLRFLNNSKTKTYYIALIAACFAVLSNFGLLNFFLALMVLHQIPHFLTQKSFNRKEWLLYTRPSFIVFIGLFIVLYEPFRKIMKFKLIDFGGTRGFWLDTVQSLTVHLYNGWVTYTAAIILIIGVLSTLLYFIIKRLRQKQYDILKSPLFIVFGLLLLISIGTVLQHYLLGMKFLEDRFALYLFPLFVLNVLLFFNYCWTNNLKRLSIGLTFPALLFVFYAFSKNFNSTILASWGYDKCTKTMLLEVAKQTKNKEAVIIKTHWLYTPTAQFYQRINHFDHLTVIRSDDEQEGDYLYTQNKLMKNKNYDAFVLTTFSGCRTSLIDLKGYLGKNKK